MTKKQNHLKNSIDKLKKELAAEHAFLKWFETFSKETQPILNNIIDIIKKEFKIELNETVEFTALNITELNITENLKNKSKKKIKVSVTTYAKIKEFMLAYQLYTFSIKSNKNIRDEKNIDPVLKAFSHWLHSLPEIVKPDLDSILRISFMEIKPGVERRYKGKSLDEYYEQIRSYGEEVYEQAIDFLCNYSDYSETVFEEDD